MKFTYPSFKEALYKQQLAGDITGLNIKCALVDTGVYTPQAAHDFADDLSGVIATSGNLANLTIVNEGSATSGTLTVGRVYLIQDYQAGDDFTNVGASSNADGVVFVATGDTPTTWTNLSTVVDLTKTLDADNVTFTGVSGNSIEAGVFYVDTGTPGTSHLISYIDGLSLTPDGGNITGTVGSIVHL